MRISEKSPDSSAADNFAADYVERVNRAVDHVMVNLSEKLTLEAVARAACFSPFHFHRVFKARMGETLGEFVKRQRLERALQRMASRPRRPLTDIALDCGFASSSDFSRCFRQHYGVAPSAFDVASHRQSKREALENTGVLPKPPAGGNSDGFIVTLRDLPPRTVAYRRVLDPWHSFDAVVKAYRELMVWAETRGVADRQWLGYMWEDPEIADSRNCRYDAAVEVDDVCPNGLIGRFDFPAMRVAEVRIAGGLELEARACDWLFETWLPRSGYMPDDQPSFESWIGRPFAHGMSHFTLACQLPVRRLM